MPKEYMHWIGGNWVKASSGKTFDSIIPAQYKKSLGRFQAGNKQDINAAVDAASEVFLKWSSLPAPKRGQILFKIAAVLKKRKKQLALLITQEMGKPIVEALGDVQESIDAFEYMAGEGRRLFGFTTPSELPDKAAFTLRKPFGVVGMITPWNFPIAIPAWKISAALICGNTFVLKPAEQTPLCAIELMKVFEKAGLPKGVGNLVTGFGEQAGQPLVVHKKVRALSFTGSKKIGELITQKAGTKKVGLELGGKNAIIIMDDADLKLALEGVIWGAFGTTGQRCTATSRVILHKSIVGTFTKQLIAKTKKIKLGPGWLKTTDMGPLIEAEAVKKVHRYTLVGKKEGATLLCGGKRLEQQRQGYYYEPTVFADVTSDMRIAREEIFGPTLSLLAFSNLNEAIDIVNSVEYGLSSSIYTKDIRNAFKAIQGMDTGIAYVNSSTIGSEVHLPFGGVKSTGNGTREAGIEGIHEFSETKTVYIDYSGRLQRAQID